MSTTKASHCRENVVSGMGIDMGVSGGSITVSTTSMDSFPSLRCKESDDTSTTASDNHSHALSFSDDQNERSDDSEEESEASSLISSDDDDDDREALVSELARTQKLLVECEDENLRLVRRCNALRAQQLQPRQNSRAQLRKPQRSLSCKQLKRGNSFRNLLATVKHIDDLNSNCNDNHGNNHKYSRSSFQPPHSDENQPPDNSNIKTHLNANTSIIRELRQKNAFLHQQKAEVEADFMNQLYKLSTVMRNTQHQHDDVLRKKDEEIRRLRERLGKDGNDGTRPSPVKTDDGRKFQELTTKLEDTLKNNQSLSEEICHLKRVIEGLELQRMAASSPMTLSLRSFKRGCDNSICTNCPTGNNDDEYDSSSSQDLNEYHTMNKQFMNQLESLELDMSSELKDLENELANSFSTTTQNE